jgi:tol-pal system protein YbgF
MLGTAEITIIHTGLPPNSPMTRPHRRAHYARTLPAAVLAVALLWAPGTALAQERSSGGFLDNLFNPNRQQQQQQQQQPQQPQQPAAQQPLAAAPPPAAQADGSDLSGRVSRIENALRQLTGTIEQLQHQNQILQMQLKRMQDDTEYRFQQLGARSTGSAAPNSAPNSAPMSAPMAAPNTAAPAAAASDRRSDAFNPALHPNAPGAPHALGNPQAIAAPEPPGQNVANQQQIGAPGGRPAGAPLDLSSLAGNGQAPPPRAPVANAAPMAAPQGGAPMSPPQQRSAMRPPQSGQLPPPPPRNPNATGTQLATLPPSSSPKDEYELAYGYVLHKDYGLAEQAFRDFLRKYPHEKLLPDAQFWLGEAQFQQQRYHDAAESFLAVSTKYAHSGKAPESLLRLGQSLAALHQKEAACATLAEVGRKYPRAAARVKRAVAHEQKRTHC